MSNVLTKHVAAIVTWLYLGLRTSYYPRGSSIHLGYQRSCHSNLVRQGVMGGEVQVPVCVGLLPVNQCG